MSYMQLMPWQGSDPLRLDSLVNTWDDEGGIAMLNGALPSLNMNLTLGQQLGVRAQACVRVQFRTMPAGDD